MSDRWTSVRRQALAARQAVKPGAVQPGLALVRVTLEDRELDVLELNTDDVMLRGARAMCGDYFVAYDCTLSPERAAFALAHELGHIVLHQGSCRCAEADIDERPVTERLPYGEATVDPYNPRQRRELEANVFAAAFLLPADEIRAQFAAGVSFDRLATDYGVSPTAVLNALAVAVLEPPSPLPAAPGGEHPLDPSQQAAAEVDVGPVLISAGPGTGKTSTLRGRVEHLLRSGVPARQILAVTFSNRAANEMRERLLQAVPEQAHELSVSTFHAFCLEILRQHYVAAGLPADVRIIDQVDAAVLLERNLASLDLEHYLTLGNPAFYLKHLLRAISRAKDELKTPEDYAQLAAAARLQAGDDPDALAKASKWAEVARVYATYERLLGEHGWIDFGGLVMRTVQLLRDRADILASLRERYVEILVDEYQDMNWASGELLRLLAGDGRGLWVVGDLRQAIYRFRGASPANITHFTQHFPGGRVIELGRNYRSDPRLVALFGAAGAQMGLPGEAPPSWEAFWPGEPPPRVWLAEAESEQAEGAGIAAEILRRHAGGRAFGEQAILVRTHAQADAIVAALERAAVPVLYLGDLFGRDEVRDLLGLLTLVAEGNGAGLLRVGAMPEHALPRRDRVRLLRLAREREASFPAALTLGAEAALPPSSLAAVADLRATLTGIGWQMDPWQFLVRYLFGHGTLVRRLLQDGSVAAYQQLMAMGQLLSIARAYGERPPVEETDPSGVLRAFLTHVRRLVAADDSNVRTPPGGEALDAVRVLTIHASKGLEFPVVYVTNLADKRFPPRGRSDLAPPPPGLTADGESGDQFSEEARLFFVAISRAKKDLVLSYASTYGKSNYAPSALLNLVEPFFAGEPPERLRWVTDSTGDAAENVNEPVGLGRPLDMGEVELYTRCPRRYEYRYVLDLHERDELLAYRRFQGCLTRVFTQLRTNHRAGTLLDADATLELLATEWDHRGPTGHTHEALYRAVAERTVVRLRDVLEQRTASRVWREHLDIEVGPAIVRIRLDDSEIDASGQVHIRRVRHGRQRAEDRGAPRLSLLRAAAAKELGTPEAFAIELDYPMLGETQNVKDAGRWEARRIEQIERTVTGILAGRYPTEGIKKGECALCPYWMICPA